MAKQDISFSGRELEALKQIVSDWLHEELTLPPFEPEIEAILKKLGIHSNATHGAATPAQDTRTAGSGAAGPTTA